MELILRPLENPNDPVWSVIIMVMMCVGLASYVIYYILKLAAKEMEEPLDKTQDLD